MEANNNLEIKNENSNNIEHKLTNNQKDTFEKKFKENIKNFFLQFKIGCYRPHCYNSYCSKFKSKIKIFEKF